MKLNLNRERYDYLDDLELFEPIKGLPKNRRSNKSNESRRFIKQKPEIASVVRQLEVEDARRIDKIGKKALEACGEKPTYPKKPEQYGVSLLSPKLARHIYGRYFLDAADPRESLKRFNATVNDFIKKDPDHATTVTASLGEIAITDYPLVSARIINSQPMSIREMRDQEFRLFHLLTGDEDYSRRLSNIEVFPNLSFERFETIDSANNFGSALIKHDSELRDKPILIKPPSINWVLV